MAGNKRSQGRIHKGWIILVWVILFSLLLVRCGGAKTYTIGAVNYSLPLDVVFDGFKAGMAELGYVEGENVTYIYSGVVEAEAVDSEIERLLAQDVDLLFTMGAFPTLRAKQAVEGTDVPIVFSPVIDPVGEGTVESIRDPGGSVTDVQTVDTIPKALE